MSGVAAVQARILEIQSRFPAPALRTAATVPATSANGTSRVQDGGFGDVLARATSRLQGSPTGEQVVAKAKEHLGTPYLWGGENPGGFDCSGLMQWTYEQFGVDLPRVSSDQAKAGRAVTAAEARPGDLVFFDRPGVDHIGMYAGNGTWVVAPKTGDVVKVQSVDLSKATTIRRVLPEPVATVAPSTSGAGSFASLFSAAGREHGVPAALLSAVAKAESGFDPRARSSAGAQGLMQLMPGTARELGVDPWDPAQAVDGAARLLKQHLSRFGSTELALAAYNAGPGAVVQHGGIPPYRETRDYVQKVMAELGGGAR